MSGQYDDIIHLPHHVSSKRKRMSLYDRAAQFSPFAALTGYDAAIEETGRRTDSKIEMDEDARIELDRKQQILVREACNRPEIRITYFEPDERKTGGAYRSVSGRLWKLDPYKRILILESGRQISLDEVLDIESELFTGLEFGIAEDCLP